ncbi:MAG: CHAT domain-containing protein [Pyrinomonadaceae bacterium]
METGTAGQGRIRSFMQIYPNVWARVNRSISIVITLVLMSVASLSQNEQQRISTLYSKGYFDQISSIGPGEITKLSTAGRIVDASKVAIPTCRTFIQHGRYDDATQLVDSLVIDPQLRSQSPETFASLLFCKASVLRAKRNYQATYEILRQGLAGAPNDSATRAAFQLEVGRTLYAAGHDFAAIVWLEQAEKTSSSKGHTAIYYDALRFLSLAWTAKFYYANALNYAEKLVEKSSRGEFEQRNRIAHLELGGLLDLTGQQQAAKAIYIKGLGLSLTAKINYHSGQFLSALLLKAVFENNVETAEKYLRQLESIDSAKQFTYETLLGNALVANYQGDRQLSDDYFSKLAREDATSEFIVPYWRSRIAERDQDWKNLVHHSESLRKMTEESSFQDDLPGIYYKLALGSWRLGDVRSAREYTKKALSLFEPFRNTTSTNLSIATMEVHHSIYRLLSEIELEVNPEKAFEYSEHLKASLLRDRIEGSTLKQRPDLSGTDRDRLLTASKNYIEGKENVETLISLEKRIISDRQTEKQRTLDFSIQGLKLPAETAVVSYQVTSSGQLLAYVVESARPLRVVRLGVTDEQVSRLASETQTKIKDRIFFKSDGKKLFDQLLKPLELRPRQLVIIPDKLLWRIPFHALSQDGQKYLIETHTISYSPSVHLLKQLLSAPPPRRRTIEIFANETFNNRKLAYVNDEVASIGRLFGVAPRLRATKADFMKRAESSDILHFSMHAQLDSDNPLSSFLAFQQNASESGRLTVADLLSVRMKPNSLAFLASCDTSKVFNGEGVVSIPWALLGSGSSSVISSQWEANDKSTQKFSFLFYQELMKGVSTSTAIQAAAFQMIQDKASGFHEPYYWGGFTLVGDFR